MTRLFYSETRVSPAFVITAGLVALLASAAISRHQHDRSVFIGASVALPFLIAGVLWFYRAGRSTFAQRHVRLVVGIYIVAQIGLIIWNILRHR